MFEDWKDPLYQCAVKHKELNTVESCYRAAMEFSYLGEYRDSREQFRWCVEELQARFHETEKRALEAAGLYASVKAVMELEQFEMTGIDGYAQAETLAKERKKELFDRELKKQEARRRLCAFCAVFAMAFLLYQSFYYFGIRHNTLKKQELILEAKGDFEGALEISRELLWGRYARWAEEKIPGLQRQIGYCLIGEGNYEKAVNEFTILEDEEGIRKARVEWGRSLRGQGKYEDALEQFTLISDKGQKKNTYFAWSQNLEEKGEYQDAIKVLRRMEKDLECGEDKRLPVRKKRLYEERCGEAIRSVTESGALSVDNKEAGRIGNTLDDLDGLLRFCEVLDEAGADLKSIFPDGVEVLDVSLSAYQPDGANAGVKKSLFQEKKVLPFSREEKITNPSQNSKNTLPDLMLSGSLPEESEYRICFLPALWQEIPVKQRGRSWEECALILLSDTVFRKFVSLDKGYVILMSEMRMYTGTHTNTITNYQYYPLFYALDNTAIYEKDSPDHLLLVSKRWEYPEELNSQTAPEKKFISVESMSGLDYDRFYGKRDRDYSGRSALIAASLFKENGWSEENE